jgi:membrane-associated phospholipid phosphatase
VLSTACALALGLALGAPPAPQDPQIPNPPEDQQPAGIERPFHDLFSNLTHDIRALPSAETTVILAAGTTVALLALPADDNLSAWAERGANPSYTRVGSVLGNGWLQAGGAVAAYAIGRARKQPMLTHVGVDLIRAQLLNGIATRGLKIAANRRRPSGGNHSLPSGHSSAAFATAAVLGRHYGWKIALPAYAAAGFIGWTRVHDNAHWVTDVLVGGAVGTLVGRTITRGHGSQNWTVVPSASTSAAAVYVVKR